MLTELTNLKFNIFLRSHLDNNVFIEIFYFDKTLKIDLVPSKTLKEPKDFLVTIYKNNGLFAKFKIKYLNYPFLFSVYNYYDYKKINLKTLKKELINFINYFPIFLSDDLILSFLNNYELLSEYTLRTDFNIKGLSYEIFPEIKIYDSSVYLEPLNYKVSSISDRKINYIFRKQILTTLNIKDLLNFNDIDKFYIKCAFNYLNSFELTPFLTEKKLGFFLFLPNLNFVYILYFDKIINKYKVLTNESKNFVEYILDSNVSSNFHFENELKNCIKKHLKNNQEDLKFFIDSCIKKDHLSSILKEIISYNEYTELEYKISLQKIINY